MLVLVELVPRPPLGVFEQAADLAQAHAGAGLLRQHVAQQAQRVLRVVLTQLQGEEGKGQGLGRGRRL